MIVDDRKEIRELTVRSIALAKKSTIITQILQTSFKIPLLNNDAEDNFI